MVGVSLVFAWFADAAVSVCSTGDHLISQATATIFSQHMER